MRIIYLVFLGLLSFSQANADTKSKDLKLDVPIVFEVSGGTSELNQTMATEHVEHPWSLFLAGRYQLSAVQLGVCYLAISHSDIANQAPAGSTPNANEVDSSENFNLTSLCAGVLIGNFLLLNGGYGYATFSRSENMPYATSASASTYNASGLGWLAGGSIIPIHIGNHVSIGATGYYFDATATDYSADTVSGATVTSKTSGNGSVHSFGWYAGLSIFIGL
jgi:hypothetical protein